MKTDTTEIPDFTLEQHDEVAVDAPKGFFEALRAETRTELSDLWDAIVGEVEFFVENCEHGWEVEWPQLALGERLASPTRRIFVRAPKPWVVGDWQCAAEVTVHIDTKSPRPVCAYLYIPQMKHASAVAAQTHCAILNEAAQLITDLLNIDSLALLPTKESVSEEVVEDAEVFEGASDAC